MRIRTVWMLACCLAAFATSGAAQVRRRARAVAATSPAVSCCFLPLELGDGLILGRAKTNPYTASLRLHPSLGIGRRAPLRIGASGALVYFNPDIDFLGGVRASYRVLESGGVLGVVLAGEGLWGTRGRQTAGGALVVDLAGFIQLSFRGARELRDDETVLEMTFGTTLGRRGAP